MIVFYKYILPTSTGNLYTNLDLDLDLDLELELRKRLSFLLRSHPRDWILKIRVT
jgi:hypothetical protein